MEPVTATPKTRKPRVKTNVKEPVPEPTLEQPKTRKPRTKTTIKEQMPGYPLEQPKAKAKAKAKESPLEQPKATPKEPKPKEPKPLILQSEKEALFREKSKLRQLKDAERIYNNAIKQLQR